jgi:nickel transport protein
MSARSIATGTPADRDADHDADRCGGTRLPAARGFARRAGRHAAIAFGAATLGLGAAVHAHTVWLEPAAAQHPGESRWEVRFGGHQGRVVAFEPGKLQSVEAWDAAGRPLASARQAGTDGVTVAIRGTPATVAMHLDNGIHSRVANGPSVEKPMDEVPGATKATWAPKWYKAILAWNDRSTLPIGQRFEVVPLAATPPRAGQPMQVRVLIDGRPAAGVRIGHGEEPPEGATPTGADGVGTYVPTHGANRVWAGRRDPVAGNPRYTELSYEYVLAFEVAP